MYLKRVLVIAGIALASLLAGCVTPLPAPVSHDASMAIIQPIAVGKMRVGLAFNTYTYHEHPGRLIIGDNQNRVICPDVKNTTTGDVVGPSPVLTSSLTPQCYYPNLKAGTYTFQDYKFNHENETYRVLFVTLSRSLLFRHDELKFHIGPGQVKYLGKYIVYFKQSGSDLAIDHITKLDARQSIKQAKLDLARQKSPWKLR